MKGIVVGAGFTDVQLARSLADSGDAFSSPADCRCGGALRLVAPEDGETVSLLAEEQRRFLDSPAAERAAWIADPERRRTLRASGFARVKLVWEDAGAAAGGPRRSYAVSVVRERDGLPVFFETTAGTGCEVKNLEAGREWRWTVRAVEGGRAVAEATGRFRTEDRAPRVLDAGAVPNVRDIGGRAALGGRRVRQGLVFRMGSMNGNSRSGVFSRAQLVAMKRAGVLTARAASWRDRKAFLDAVRDRTLPVRPVGFPVSRGWTVFYPDKARFAADGLAALSELRGGIPASFLGARPVRKTADAEGSVDLGAPEDRKGPAVLMQVVEAVREGTAVVGCGADWYWSFRCGGVPVANYLFGGNPAAGTDAGSAALLVPVKRGANLVAAVVYSGSCGWRWCMREAPEVPLARALAESSAAAEERLDDLSVTDDGCVLGASRVDDPATRHLLLDTLAVKTDLDLRSAGECAGMTGSPLGGTVAWAHLPMAFYGEVLAPQGRALFRDVLRVFLDPGGYPVAMHCYGGRDRTGTVAFLLGGLLGVEEDELCKDYETTVFQDRTLDADIHGQFLAMVEGIRALPGGTLPEKIEGFVLSLGFSRDDIEKLRGLLLE